jgi:hypothetical protein
MAMTKSRRVRKGKNFLNNEEVQFCKTILHVLHNSINSNGITYVVEAPIGVVGGPIGMKFRKDAFDIYFYNLFFTFVFFLYLF